MKNILTIFFLLINVILFSQNKKPFMPCFTVEHESYLRKNNVKLQSVEEFENWLQTKIENQKKLSSNTSVNSVITIPVVFHVVHSNKPYGVEENLLDGQILSQITTLNQDYRKQVGTPGFNTNPVGADAEIEFCLAQRDPQGNATSGINRISIPTPSGGWNPLTVDFDLKPITIWNPEEYLNIWIVDEMNFFGGLILGYANFPLNSTLQGLDGINPNPDIDGVVLSCKFVGSRSLFPTGNYFFDTNTQEYFNDDGRTATHEVGHYLGLRHIWGDETICNGNGDYCADTPPANSPNQECEIHWSCGGFNMIENYMDYTPGSCMNIFTVDQKTRMRTVLNYATRRFTLLNSEACIPPQTHGFDLQLKSVVMNKDACSDITTPVIELKNNGTSTIISSFLLTYTVDNGTPQQYNWSGTLAVGSVITLNLPSQIFPVGDHIANFTLSQINGSVDDYTFNNSKILSFKTKPFVAVNTTVVNIEIKTDNNGNQTTWQIKDSNNVVVANGGGNYNEYPGVYGNHQVYNSSFVPVNGECYTFEIADGFANGICCDEGPGYYKLLGNNGVFVQGGQFSDFETKYFKVDQSLSSNSFDLENDVTIYPNPTSDFLNINSKKTIKKYELINVLGQVVIRDNTSQLDLSKLQSGSYIIKIMFIDDTFYTSKVLKK
jgi:hypothetical protein